MNILTWTQLVIGILLNVCAQLFLKSASGPIRSQLDLRPISLETILQVALSAFSNIPLLAGLGCYVVSVILWIIVLGKVPVNVAYPMQSGGYVVAAGIAFVVFGERLSPVQIVGLCAIIFGVILLNQR